MAGKPCRGSWNRTITACCIPRILRRILCFSSLSTRRPFDYILKEEEELLDSSSMVASSISGTTTPGIVARLMGLETLPLPSADSSIKNPKPPRGLIIPITYLEDEDENFFIFSFESHRRKSGKNYERMEQSMAGGANYKKKKKKRKSMMMRGKDNSMELQERDNKENMVSKQKLLLDNYSCQKIIRKNQLQPKINFETEGDSENSSPNSVLEFVEFPTDQKASTSETGNVSRLANTRMRTTLSDKYCEASKEKRQQINYVYGYGGKWDEMGMEVMMKDEIWRNQNHHFKEIGTDLASQILLQLLDELLLTH